MSIYRRSLKSWNRFIHIKFSPSFVAPGTEGKGETTAGDAGEEGKATPGTTKEGRWLAGSVLCDRRKSDVADF